VAALRGRRDAAPDGDWIDYDGEARARQPEHLAHEAALPRGRSARCRSWSSTGTIPFRRIRIDGQGRRDHEGGRPTSTSSAAARVYLGRDSYELQPGEERVLVRIEPVRIEATNIE
jgi:hypothetical protein